jgi:Trypsin-like serine proteases, typically periplasmic, contain C-terminal PDZ domain
MRFVSWGISVALALFAAVSGDLFAQTRGEPRSSAEVHFPANQSSVQIPFEFLANSVFIPVKVQGKGPYLFYVDTGASDAIIASEKASLFGLHTKSMGSSMGAGSDYYDMGDVEGKVEFSFPGGLSVTTDHAVTISMKGTWPLIGQAIYGNIGREILKHFIVQFDYEKHVLTLFDPAKFHYSGKGQHFPSPMRGEISGPDGKAISTEFSVDTGAGGTTITAALVRENHLLEKVTQKIPSPSHGIGNGVSDDVVGRLGDIHLGTYSLKNPLVALSRDTVGSLSRDAFVNMGGNLLSRFTVTIDYIHHEVTLEANSHIDEPFLADASGLVMEAGGDDFRTFTVKGVVADSPGDKAGLKEGDIIAEIDGTAAGKYALWELQNILKESGKEHSLTVRRDGKAVKAQIHLRALA